MSLNVVAQKPIPMSNQPIEDTEVTKLRDQFDRLAARASEIMAGKNVISKSTLRRLSETCCCNCEYDEAEGNLFRHCEGCMEVIVRELWKLTHS